MRIESFSTARLLPPPEMPGGPEVQRAAGSPTAPSEATGGPDRAEQRSFSELLAGALGRVNDSLQAADVQARRVATGEAESLHEPLIAMAEADLALQVTMRVTQKAIAAYQEISRMQL